MSRQLSPKALDRLSRDLGELTTRYDALSRQVATLHLQGGSAPQSAYYVGVAQTLARDISNKLDQLSNAIYNLSLQAQKDNDAALSTEANTSSQRRQEERKNPQANSGAGLDTPRPGPSDVRDQVAAAPLDQPRADQPVV